MVKKSSPKERKETSDRNKIYAHSADEAIDLRKVLKPLPSESCSSYDSHIENDYDPAEDSYDENEPLVPMTNPFAHFTTEEILQRCPGMAQVYSNYVLRKKKTPKRRDASKNLAGLVAGLSEIAENPDELKQSASKDSESSN